MAPLDDLRGTHDMNGHELGVTVIGIADEIACAAGLAMRKAAGVAAVLVRGCEIAPEPAPADQRGGRSMIRPREHDLFR
jgi:coenzyme F420-0:L-glutamate ligase / coenzyme F420-1:gamma-L-glutamate ligase